jgi:hypothetical protein
VAIASGKGGTGKTTVAVSLALVAASLDLSAAGITKADAPRTALLDCDVEEPNAHLFLRTTMYERRDVGVPYPNGRAGGGGDCRSLAHYPPRPRHGAHGEGLLTYTHCTAW